MNNITSTKFVFFQISDPKAKFSGYIPLNKVEITYSASSGPGGQNVNCVNTKVDLRFQVNSATWLTEEVRTKLAEQVLYKMFIIQYKLLIDAQSSFHLKIK